MPVAPGAAAPGCGASFPASIGLSTYSRLRRQCNLELDAYASLTNRKVPNIFLGVLLRMATLSCMNEIDSRTNIRNIFLL